jgi:hypothetical protein
LLDPKDRCRRGSGNSQPWRVCRDWIVAASRWISRLRRLARFWITLWLLWLRSIFRLFRLRSILYRHICRLFGNIGRFLWNLCGRFLVIVVTMRIALGVLATLRGRGEWLARAILTGLTSDLLCIKTNCQQ